MNWRKNWATYLFFVIGLLVAVGLCMYAVRTQPGRIEYFYMEKGPVFHLDPKCKKGLVFIKASDVFNVQYKAYYFCSNCITPAELEQIQDSIAFRHSIVTSGVETAEK